MHTQLRMDMDMPMQMHMGIDSYGSYGASLGVVPCCRMRRLAGDG